jgi:GNAT superfamily N-acetyltransferase
LARRGTRRIEEGQVSEEVSLKEQLIARIDELTQATEVDLAANIERFPELKAAITPPGYMSSLVPGEAGAKARLEDGAVIELVGGLHLPGHQLPIATFKRTLNLDGKWAYHDHFEVRPDYRGRGISLQFLRGCFKLYDDLGLTEAHVQASETGRWHWARIGFQFSPASAGDKVREWAAELAEALRLPIVVSADASTTQLVGMGGLRKISMADIAAAVPRKAGEAKKAAECNGFEMEERIDFGRAMLLTGPEWDGRLGLQEADRVLFDIALEDKEERLARQKETE